MNGSWRREIAIMCAVGATAFPAHSWSIAHGEPGAVSSESEKPDPWIKVTVGGKLTADDYSQIRQQLSTLRLRQHIMGIRVQKGGESLEVQTGLDKIEPLGSTGEVITFQKRGQTKKWLVAKRSTWSQRGDSPEDILYRRPTENRPPDPQRDKIEELAIAAVVKKKGKKPSEFYVRATRDGDGWSVHVKYLPLFPGNFCVLRMSATGEVLKWQGGA